MRLYAKSRYTEFKYAKGKTDIYGKTFHDSIELFMLVSGNVEFVNEHTRVKLLPYQLVIIPKGSYHQFIVNGDIEEYERFVFNISSELLGDDCIQKALCGKEIMTLSENHRITEHFMYIKDCISSVSKADIMCILDALAADTVMIIKNSNADTEMLHGSLHSISVEVMTYINNCYSEITDMEMLASRFHMSSSSLWHIFKEDFGISIKKYIMQKRMTAAYSAIKEGMQAKEAAFLCGYGNYSAFYRCFTEYFGYPPSEVLRNKKAER